MDGPSCWHLPALIPPDHAALSHGGRWSAAQGLHPSKCLSLQEVSVMDVTTSQCQETRGEERKMSILVSQVGQINTGQWKTL